MRMKLTDYIPRIRGRGIAGFNKRAFNLGHGETFYAAFDKEYGLKPLTHIKNHHYRNPEREKINDTHGFG